MPIDLTTTLQTVLHRLETEKDRVERQIMSVRDALNGAGDRKARPARRRRMSAAERQTVSRRMKAYWAKRRAAGAHRQSTGQPADGARTMARRPAGTPSPARRRRRLNAAARRAIGRRMRAYWAKRKAQARRAPGSRTPGSSSTKNGSSQRRRATRRTAARRGRKGATAA
jgi:hypothetical protein